MTQSITAMKYFDGSDLNACRSWLKSVNIFAEINGYQPIAVAFETTDRPVSGVIEKAVSEGSLVCTKDYFEKVWAYEGPISWHFTTD